MDKKKKLVTALTVTAVIAAAAITWSVMSRNGRSTLTYETVHVSRGSISNSVTATGTIEPVTEVTVGTQVSGIIDHIYVDYNSVVTEGQLIAEMDKVTLESELESAKAQYDGCKAEYEYQEKNYQRSRGLHEKALISESEYELALYNYKMAESSYHSSEAALAKAERNLSYATITSPISGVVIDKAVEEGQTVAAGFSTPTLFTIAADLTQMQVVADVDEADIGGVKEGQKVEFTVDAYPDDVFEGKVTQIRLGSSSSSSASTSTTSESVVTYEVVISADNPDLKLKPRLTANITIYTVERNDVLTIPSKALRFEPVPPFITSKDTVNDCKGRYKVWVKEGNVFTAYPVRPGLSDGVTTEISGIEEGLEIVVGTKDSTSKTTAQKTERSPFMPAGRNAR